MAEETSCAGSPVLGSTCDVRAERRRRRGRPGHLAHLAGRGGAPDHRRADRRTIALLHRMLAAAGARAPARVAALNPHAAKNGSSAARRSRSSRRPAGGGGRRIEPVAVPVDTVFLAARRATSTRGDHVPRPGQIAMKLLGFDRASRCRAACRAGRDAAHGRRSTSPQGVATRVPPATRSTSRWRWRCRLARPGRQVGAEASAIASAASSGACSVAARG